MSQAPSDADPELRNADGRGGADEPLGDAGTRVVTFGEVLYDTFPDGSRVPGGAPFNVAWHLCGFGDDPALLTAVGDDEAGRAIQGELASWGLDTRGVRTVRDAPTGLVRVLPRDDDADFEIPEGQAWDRLSPDPARLAALRASARLLYHGTLALRSETSRRGLRTATEGLGCPTFVDLNLRDPWWTEEVIHECLRAATWVKVNQHELGVAAGRSTPTSEACVDTARELRERFDLEALIVTRGAAGSLLVNRAGDVVRADAVAVADPVDTVGAGDAFSACVCHGILQGWDDEEILRRAAAFAAEACRFPGATATDLAVYDRHLREWADVPLRTHARTRPPAPDGLYVLSLSVHGLVRGSEIELGRDADTGGQVSYTVDQARALGRHPHVGRVDLVTRLVEDKRVDESYARPEESLGDGARIIRLPFGPRRYLHKESLWPHLDALLDALVRHVRSVGRPPDVIHGHYADAGYVGAQLGKLLGVPFVFTGHSLGRLKRERLLADGRDADVIEERYHLRQRIEAEERALETADLVVASTPQEVEEQYRRYDHHVADRVAVIPPGVGLDRFSPPSRFWTPPPVIAAVSRFLDDPGLPWVLALARPDERKNFDGLLTAFATTPGLRERANLILVAGNRDDIGELPKGQRRVLTDILLAVDRYDLYGSVAYPKTHRFDDVPELYRMAARTRGLFVNPALTEPFGLTLIEAAASGVPVVATDDGGPRSILEVCANGVLADPLDPERFGRAILDSLEDRAAWGRRAKSGVSRVHGHFSWTDHARRYVDAVEEVLGGQRPAPPMRPPPARLAQVDHLVVVDLDAYDDGGVAVLRDLEERAVDSDEPSGVVASTRRTLDTTLERLRSGDAPTPDLLITASGTRIHYGPHRVRDRSWERQIRYRWEPERVRDVLLDADFVRSCSPADDAPYRLTCVVDADAAEAARHARRVLRRAGVRATTLSTGPHRLDVLPVRASPELAVRFVSYKWNVPMDRVHRIPGTTDEPDSDAPRRDPQAGDAASGLTRSDQR